MTVSIQVSGNARSDWQVGLQRAGFDVIPAEHRAEATVVVTDEDTGSGIDEARIVRVTEDVTTEKLIALVAARTERLSDWKSADDGFDPLTGLIVKEALFSRIENEIELSTRIMKPFAVAIIEPDNFEEITAGLGQQAGDHALREFSQFLSTHFRRIDGVGRWGAQELAIVMPATYPSAAMAAIARIQGVLAGQGGSSESISSFSAGVSAYPVDANDRDALFSMAEDRLADARRKGAGRVVMG